MSKLTVEQLEEKVEQLQATLLDQSVRLSEAVKLLTSIRDLAPTSRFISRRVAARITQLSEGT